MAEKQERRTLGMHPRLLWDIIHKQAGSLDKSVLEGVMNSVDAAGTRCDITLDSGRLVIADDGKGFVGRDEVESMFETFGTPHEEGDATYGRYRMGRGQLFAIGRNVWSSNEFVMDVDLKPQGGSKGKDFTLGYDLSEVDAAHRTPGCKVDVALYDRMNAHTLNATLRSIEEAVAWVSIPVVLNGKQISADPAKANWDQVTDDAYIKLSTKGSLTVYNLGVKVCEYPSSKYGTGGVIVSRHKLDVNFARNSIQGTCKVWNRIAKGIDRSVGSRIAKATRLTDNERERLVMALVDGEAHLSTILKQEILTDVTGTHRSVLFLTGKGRKNWNGTVVTSAPVGDRIGDVVMQRGLALVLGDTTLDRFHVGSMEELIGILADAATEDLTKRGIRFDAREKHIWSHEHRDDPVIEFRNALMRCKVEDFATFEQTFKRGHMPLQTSELKRGEIVALEALGWASRTISDAVWRINPDPGARRQYMGRTISAGTSDDALAWTDGTRNIWFERRQLPLVKTSVGRSKLAAIMLHEYLHREPDTDTHVHGVEFYRTFHDLSVHYGVLDGAARQIELGLERRALQADRKAKPGEALIGDELEALAGEQPDVGDEEAPGPAPGR